MLNAIAATSNMLPLHYQNKKKKMSTSKSNICEHPLVIVRHDIRTIVMSAVELHFGSHVSSIVDLTPSVKSDIVYNYDARFFSPIRRGVNTDNINDYYAVMPDGECICMYQVVPCGKCALCRNKKSNEWSCRCSCETLYSTSVPLFVTLTLNNEYLTDKVDKSVIQKFFKRLRIDLDRNYDYVNPLRYVCVGEYGSRTNRPHYHAIIWNAPVFDMRKLLSIIENNWQQGFVYLKPCDTGAVSYVLKYLRKSDGNEKFGFFLASRGGKRKTGGIGYQYAKDYSDFYRSNPQQMSIELTEKYTGKQLSFCIPQYYTNKFYPSRSALVSLDYRVSFRLASVMMHHYLYLSDIYKLANHTFVEQLRADLRLLSDMGLCNYTEYITASTKHYLDTKNLDYVADLVSDLTILSDVIHTFVNNFDFEQFISLLDIRTNHKKYLEEYIFDKEDTATVSEKLMKLKKISNHYAAIEIF